MRDPKRWSDPGGGADVETRALLQQAPQVAPSPSQVSQMWAGLAPQLDIAHPPSGPSQGQPGVPGHGLQTAAGAGAGALAGKVTLAVVLATAVGALGVRVIASRDRHVAEPQTTQVDHRPSLPTASPIPSEPSDRLAAATAVPTSAVREHRSRVEKTTHPRSLASASPPAAPTILAQPVVVEDRIRPAPATPTQPRAGENRAPQASASPARPSVDEDRIVHERATGTRVAAEVTPPPESPPISASELLQESRRLDRARAALRAGEPAHALRLLRDSAPATTALAQEREALTIEAQAAIPTLRAAAAERARAFMRTYPNSPYRVRIKALVLESQ